MYRLHAMEGLPENFDEFIEEIAAGFTGLYGEEAARQYRAGARHSFLSALKHESAGGLALREGDDTAGFLIRNLRENVGQVSFIHVLKRHAGRGVEDRLVRETVRTFRAAGVDAVLSECIAFCPLALDAAYEAFGFERIERAVLTARTDDARLAVEGVPVSQPFRADRYPEVARVIVDAYRDHPGRKIQVEVHNEYTARNFLEAVECGEYGEARPGYQRAVDREGRCLGAIIGCEAAPQYGFILQVAVRQTAQGQGMGARLIREIIREFRRAGLTRVSLGVTLDSPAFRLYQRLGFEVLRPVNAYVWWRP